MSDELLFDRRWQDRETRISITIDKDYRTRATLAGRGTAESARQLVRLLDEAIAQLGRNHRTNSKVDMRELYDSSVRSQMILGKWLFSNKSLVAQISIVGGSPWEIKIARAVMKIARMEAVHFFETEDEATRFLGW